MPGIKLRSLAAGRGGRADLPNHPLHLPIVDSQTHLRRHHYYHINNVSGFILSNLLSGNGVQHAGRYISGSSNSSKSLTQDDANDRYSSLNNYRSP